jgi:hypothetical protein
MCFLGSVQTSKRRSPCRVVTSIDGFNAYLLIACAKTRYTFCFLTVSKAPPAEIIDAFLTKHGLKSGACYICMDHGSDLWRSEKIRTVAAKHDYMLEPTGSDSPSQNGKVECLNGTFSVMVRTLLYFSGLVPYVLEFCSCPCCLSQKSAPPLRHSMHPLFCLDCQHTKHVPSSKFWLVCDCSKA